jgi:hypothetical protein
MLELISKYQNSITFVWIPSHIGIKGNEAADKLANGATINQEININIGLELSEAYNLVENYIIKQWQQSWNSEKTGSHYRQIEKTVSAKIKYIHNSRHKDVIITRLRLGKCQLNAYLHEIGKHSDGLCHNCNKSETVTHFLLECPQGHTCSAVLAACNTLKITPTINNIQIGRAHV